MARSCLRGLLQKTKVSRKERKDLPAAAQRTVHDTVDGRVKKKKTKRKLPKIDGDRRVAGSAGGLTWASRRLLSVRPSKRILSSASEELL